MYLIKIHFLNQIKNYTECINSCNLCENKFFIHKLDGNILKKIAEDEYNLKEPQIDFRLPKNVFKIHQLKSRWISIIKCKNLPILLVEIFNCDFVFNKDLKTYFPFNVILTLPKKLREEIKDI